MISAILLAAGESRRMGDFKQLLRLGEKTLVEHCVDNLLASRVDKVIVVAGHRASEVAGAIGARPVTLIQNDDYRSGMASSIKRGVQSISDEAEACLIALADQPQIGATVIDEVVAAYASARPLIVIPVFEGRNGHPIIVDLRLREEMMAMDLSEGLRSIVHAHSSETIQIEVSSQAVLEDCDFQEDYQRMVKSELKR